MRRTTTLLVPVLFLALASVMGAAVGPPVEVTPEKMGEQGLSVECRFRDHTIKEGAQPTRRTGLVLVQVLFDVTKGPRIKELDSAYLVVRDGNEVILHVPIEWAGGDRPGFIQFSIHESMIPKASVVLAKNAEGREQSFAIALQKFRPAP